MIPHSNQYPLYLSMIFFLRLSVAKWRRRIIRYGEVVVEKSRGCAHGPFISLPLGLPNELALCLLVEPNH